MHKFMFFLLVVSGSLSAEKLSFQKALNLSTDRLSAIEIINGAGDIVVTTSQSSEITVNATIASDKYQSVERLKEIFNRDVVFSMDRESEYAVLRGHDKPGLRKSSVIQIHLDIQIPASMDVKIDDGSGSISVKDLDGNLSIEDGSGSITIDSIAGSLNIDDGSGDIEINQAKGPMKIEDGSGDTTITDSDGAVKINDGSGAITLLQVNGQKEIEDGSGDISIRNSHGDIKINDGSGEIKLIKVNGAATINDGSGAIYIDDLDGSLTIKSAGSGKVIIDGENRTKEFN